MARLYVRPDEKAITLTPWRFDRGAPPSSMAPAHGRAQHQHAKRSRHARPRMPRLIDRTRTALPLVVCSCLYSPIWEPWNTRHDDTSCARQDDQCSAILRRAVEEKQLGRRSSTALALLPSARPPKPPLVRPECLARAARVGVPRRSGPQTPPRRCHPCETGASSQG
jgi:hypothetical protein